jgi:hypothetical protein
VGVASGERDRVLETGQSNAAPRHLAGVTDLYTYGGWLSGLPSRIFSRTPTVEEGTMSTFSEQASAADNIATNVDPAGHEGAGGQVGGKKRRSLLGRGWRKITWVMIGWSTLIVLGGLAVSGHTANKLSSSCQNTLGPGSLCQEVGNQTAAAQFEHIMKIGVVGFVVLSIIWFMTRPQN